MTPGGIAESVEERAKRVLAERARELAAPATAAAGAALDVVAFEAGPERYALTLDAVLRIERVGAVARVPGAGAEVIGVMSVDGRPCPLVDAPALLGAAAATSPRRWAIVLGRRSPEVAVAADAVDLARLERAGLRPGAPPCVGITADARVVLDAPALMGEAAPRDGGERT